MVVSLVTRYNGQSYKCVARSLLYTATEPTPQSEKVSGS